METYLLYFKQEYTFDYRMIKIINFHCCGVGLSYDGDTFFQAMLHRETEQIPPLLPASSATSEPSHNAPPAMVGGFGVFL